MQQKEPTRITNSRVGKDGTREYQTQFEENGKKAWIPEQSICNTAKYREYIRNSENQHKMHEYTSTPLETPGIKQNKLTDTAMEQKQAAKEIADLALFQADDTESENEENSNSTTSKPTLTQQTSITQMKQTDQQTNQKLIYRNSKKQVKEVIIGNIPMEIETPLTGVINDLKTETAFNQALATMERQGYKIFKDQSNWSEKGKVGFIHFQTDQDLQAALVDKKWSITMPIKPKTDNPALKVYVSGIPKGHNNPAFENQLRTLMRATTFEIAKDITGRSKGYGFATYSTLEDAQEATERVYDLRGDGAIIIEVTKYTPKQPKDSSQPNAEKLSQENTQTKQEQTRQTTPQPAKQRIHECPLINIDKFESLPFDQKEDFINQLIEKGSNLHNMRIQTVEHNNDKAYYSNKIDSMKKKLTQMHTQMQTQINTANHTIVEKEKRIAELEGMIEATYMGEESNQSVTKTMKKRGFQEERNLLDKYDYTKTQPGKNNQTYSMNNQTHNPAYDQQFINRKYW